MSINIYSPKPSKILFIDEDYLKNVTEVGQNVDPRLIRTSIQYAQDRYILPLLGNNIFEYYKQQIQSGITNSNNPNQYLNSNDILLIQSWIQPTLACAVMIQLVYKINLQIKNKGIEQAHSEFSTVATDKQIDWLSENYREQAAFYAQRCTQFLVSNPDIWPNYLNPQLGTSGNGADLFYPSNTRYFCGIHIEGMNLNNPATSGPYVGYGMSLVQRLEFLNYE